MEKVGVKKSQDSRRRCCDSLLLSKEHTFKNVNETLKLKTRMSYNSFNVIYVVICSDYLEECTGKTDVDKTRLRDRVKVYR